MYPPLDPGQMGQRWTALVAVSQELSPRRTGGAPRSLKPSAGRPSRRRVELREAHLGPLGRQKATTRNPFVTAGDLPPKSATRIVRGPRALRGRRCAAGQSLVPKPSPDIAQWRVVWKAQIFLDVSKLGVGPDVVKPGIVPAERTGGRIAAFPPERALLRAAVLSKRHSSGPFLWH